MVITSPTEAAQALKAAFDTSQRAVFFGGAGVSTASGIPDFRSVDGLYHQQFAYPPETILSHTFFMHHTDEFYDFYRSRMLPLAARPNQAHLKLAELERDGKLAAVVTQNIDGLHQKAGSHNVFELHGSIYRNYCMCCNAAYSAEWIKETSAVPHCEACGGIVKPDVVLYEEMLDDAVVQGAIDAIAHADLLVIGGTSLVVYPAAGLINYFKGSQLIVCNLQPTAQDEFADIVCACDIASAFTF